MVSKLRIIWKQTVPVGGHFRVRDVWAQQNDLGVAVAPLTLTSPSLQTDTVHMIRVSRVKSDGEGG